MINLSIFCIYLACNNGCSYQGEQTQLVTHTGGGGYQAVGGKTLYEYQVVITGNINITMITRRLNAYVVIYQHLLLVSNSQLVHLRIEYRIESC